jgi:hypothetical protein
LEKEEEEEIVATGVGFFFFFIISNSIWKSLILIYWWWERIHSSNPNRMAAGFLFYRVKRPSILFIFLFNYKKIDFVFFIWKNFKQKK